MSSSVRQATIAPSGRRASDLFLVWNRRLHYFVGLYLLFFCWLFAFTGLLLNHPKWDFAQFWPNRVQTQTEHAFRPVQGINRLAQARDLMQQLGIDGEIQWPNVPPSDGILTFQVSRPGRIVEVQADLRSARATLHSNELNAWGVIHMLHTFTGERTTDSANRRDWWLTTVWAWSMDAVAAGLVLMVFGSYVMWYRLKAKRRGGLVALALGVLTCALFIAGLRWLV
jgi:hypothetical protein